MYRLVCMILLLSSVMEAKPLINDDSARVYIEKYKHIAIMEMDRGGVPASIKMAQALLESNAGQGELAKNANNHFGIKCGGYWEGDIYKLWDDETVKSCFRVYKTAEESFIAHTEFLLNPKKAYRYGKLFKLDKTDYKAWAKGLQASGYATSKTYSKNLISLIERLELYKLDELTSVLLAVEDFNPSRYYPPLGPQPNLRPQDTTLQDLHIKDPFRNTEDSIDIVTTREIFQINGVDAVYVQPGDDIGQIAFRYRVLNTKKLIRNNELKGRELVVGQYIFLDKKKKSYNNTKTWIKKHIHIVRQGETMYSIAQQYGVQLKYLKKYNRVYKKQEPNSGVKIYLSPRD